MGQKSSVPNADVGGDYRATSNEQQTRAKGEQESLRLQFECSDNLQSFFRILSLSSHDLFFNELVKANGEHLNVLG